MRSHQVWTRRLVVGGALAMSPACSGDLVPSPAMTQARRDADRARALDAQLRALPGVVAARSLVRTPVDDPLAPAHRDAPATASIAIHAEASRAAALTDEARRLAGAALPDVDAAHLTIVVAEAAPQGLATVGPFQVAPTSRGPLRATLAAVLGLIIALAGYIAWRERRVG